MGLGLNGGGLASALFFARRGAEVTVTDLRGPDQLAASLERLEAVQVRLVLGRHHEGDFTTADLVVKNPAVRPDSPFLRAAREHGASVETDLSVFLAAVARSRDRRDRHQGQVHHRLGDRLRPGPRRSAAPGSGGNITVSPLSFLDELGEGDPVVLELSSWQLGDLRGRGLLKPAVSAFTVILPDHLDRYPGMAEYVADKKVLFREQEPGAKAVFNRDDPWQRDFPNDTRAECFFYSAHPLPDGARGAWLAGGDGLSRGAGPGAGAASEQILGGSRLAGGHNRMNLLCAGLRLRLFGLEPGAIRAALGEFPGIEHRLELFREWRGIRFYNDSAATIPHATVRAVQTLEPPLVLIAGGTDKNLDFSPLAEAARRPAAIVLLAGTATEKMRAVLDGAGTAYEGPFDSLPDAVRAAIARARPRGSGAVLARVHLVRDVPERVRQGPAVQAGRDGADAVLTAPRSQGSKIPFLYSPVPS